MKRTKAIILIVTLMTLLVCSPGCDLTPSTGTAINPYLIWSATEKTDMTRLFDALASEVARLGFDAIDPDNPPPIDQ